VINDLDATLQALLSRELPNLVTPVTLTFAAPDDEFPPSSVALPAIDLFLYDVRENRELRSAEWSTERVADGTVRRHRAPTRVDCSYLITAWSGAGATDPAHDEHHLLSEVILALLRHPTLPDEVLQGTLRTQDAPPPASALQAGRLQSVADFWQALGGRAKAVVHYTVTISVASVAPKLAGPPVTDMVVRLKQGLTRP